MPDTINGDPLRLANTRDELVLYEKGVAVQKISWPGDVKPREGQVHYLENGGLGSPCPHDRSVPFYNGNIPECVGHNLCFAGLFQ